MVMPTDFSPAADRNKDPILAVLSEWLPDTAEVLEIASGTGQHAAHFASLHPRWRWQPSDADTEALPGIAARTAELANVLPPLHLDVMVQPWPLAQRQFDALYCANLLHIAPWATCAGLMRGAARHLAGGGALVLYGPYLVDGEPTAPSNVAFDADLRARNPQWGLRRLADVAAQAKLQGLALERRVTMPANNLLLVLRREA